MKTRDLFIDREKFEAKRAQRREGATHKLMLAAGLELTDHHLRERVENSKGWKAHSLREAHATVVPSGQIAVTGRLTVTRMITFGIFSLAFPKKVVHDYRALFLIVEGPDWSVMRAFDPKLELSVREYANQINNRRMK